MKSETKKAAMKLMSLYNKGTKFEAGEKVICFARQSKEDLDKIENAKTEDLIKDWKELVFLNEIYGQVSLNELERISLIEMELADRKYAAKELRDWFKKTNEEFKKQEGLK